MINGNLFGTEAYGTGAIIALLAIVMVFIVLLVIIFLTDLVTKLAGKDDTEEKTVVPAVTSNAGALPLNINDEDAVIACLVASLDLREETKKNVQVVSVREVK